MQRSKQWVVGVLLWLTCVGGLWADSSVHVGAPTGWRKQGTDPLSYEVGTDTSIVADPLGYGVQGGPRCAYLKSISPTPKGYVTLAQECYAGVYKGQKVEFSGWIKAQNVAGWTGLWVRSDDSSDRVLGFHSMQNDNPIRGTKHWDRYHITVDVPRRADRLYFGIILEGPGQAWAAATGIRAVGPLNEPATPGTPADINPTPTNLFFNK